MNEKFKKYLNEINQINSELKCNLINIIKEEFTTYLEVDRYLEKIRKEAAWDKNFVLLAVITQVKEHFENLRQEEKITPAGTEVIKFPTEKESVCIAQHIKVYIEQCKNDLKADISMPCQTCKFNKDCDFNVWPAFMKLSNETGVLISPMLSR